MNLSKAKFFRLDFRMQHKKCADILRKIYESLLEQKPLPELWEKYNLLLSWLQMAPFPPCSIKKIADQYHFHLAKASLFLKEHNLLPPIRKGDHVAKRAFGKVAVFLDNVRSAYNVGSILRTTEALRIGPVYFAKKTPFIDNPKVIKTSMGTYSLVPCFQKNTLEDLPKPFIAIETGEEAENVDTFPFPSSCTLIIGNEEYGISDEVLSEVDIVVDIPLLGQKNSINAACAYAIAAKRVCYCQTKN